MNEFKLGDIVYLKNDPEQLSRMVTGVFHRPNGTTYYISQSITETPHYSIELSREINQEILLGIN